MFKSTMLVLTGLVFATCITISSAQAQEVWFNPFTDRDPWAWTPPEEPAPGPPQKVTNSPPPRIAPVAAVKPMSVIESATPMTNRLNDMPQMHVLGLWVGNVNYRVGSADGRLYLVSKDGTLRLLPAKTNPDTITIPEDSPVVSRLLNQNNGAGNNSNDNNNNSDGNNSNNSKNGDSSTPKIRIGQTGLLKPTVVGTRTTMVDGKPVVVAGAIISEWGTPKETSDAGVQIAQRAQHTEAMVIPKSRNYKKHKGAHRKH
jgi:hypothetical protein